MTKELQVLFVDDEENIRFTLPLMLESFGFRVTAVATVPEALRLMSERHFDVLISDMNIERPGDGFTVVSAMRSTQPKAAKFILTGYPDVDTALKALREEVDDYLVKPTDVEEIVSRIHSKLQRRSQRQESKPKRLGEIIKEQRDYITAKWLELAKQDVILSQLKLSDSERKNHIPGMLDVAAGILAGEQIGGNERQAAGKHGQTRSAQGYSVTWLIREAKLLQDAIAICVQRNLLEINVSFLIPDLSRAFGILHDLLEESVAAMLQSAEPHKQTNRKRRIRS